MWFGNPWILMIMVSVGPFSGQYENERDVWLRIQMHTEAECRQAANDIMTTAHILQHLNPNLHVDTFCKEDIPMQQHD
jgi:hypothetical protein